MKFENEAYTAVHYPVKDATVTKFRDRQLVISSD